jgi:hypothetical protein
MLVNARRTYISIDGSFYSSCGQVFLTVYCLALLHFLTLRITLSNRDRTRPNETFIITIITTSKVSKKRKSGITFETL